MGTDIIAAMMGWALFLCCSMVHCYAYKVSVLSAQWTISSGVSWSVQEWGIWVLLTPVVFYVLRRVTSGTDSVKPVVFVGAGLLAATLCYRASLHRMGSDGTFATAAMIFFPQYLVATCVVVGGWFFVLRQRSTETSTESPVPQQQILPATILVQKGKDSCLIRLSDIDSVSAAGNYIDIYCGESHYVLRSTLKDFAQRLPCHEFVRVHRSHIVQVTSIERIQKTTSGGAGVLFVGGRKISVSKSYLSQLKAEQQAAFQSAA